MIQTIRVAAKLATDPFGQDLLAEVRRTLGLADAHIGGDDHGAFNYYLDEAIQKGGARLTYRDLVQATADGLSQGQYGQLPQLGYRGDNDQKMVFRAFG